MAEVNNDEIMSALDKDRAMDIWRKTVESYPVMKDVDFSYKPSGVEQPEGAGIETYGVQETYRPAHLPLGKVGIGAWSSKGLDAEGLVGDYLSHHLVYNDPKIAEMYKQFQTQTMANPQSQDFLKELYRESQDFGEKRPYEQWLQVSGWPQYLRGYVSRQFTPENYSKVYSPEQIKLMDQMRQMVGLK
jgi:hypothetical protein